MSDIFISYSRIDRVFTQRLCDAFADQHQQVWIDWEAIPPSQSWWAEIQAGIAKANNCVVILSPNAMSSPICHLEIETARQLGKRIIPVHHAAFDREACLENIANRLEADTTARTLWGERVVADLYDSNVTHPSHLNYFFFGGADDFEARFNALIEIIRTDFAHKEQHTRVGLRAAEWDRRMRDASFLLIGSELTHAERWLVEADTAVKDPAPPALHRAYIADSRREEDRRRRILRRLRTATGVFAVVGMLAALTVVVALNRVANANAEVAVANATVAPVPTILAEAEAQVAAANGTLTPIPVTLTTAGQLVSEARRQVAISGQTLTPVPPTLTAVAAAIAQAEREQDIAVRLANTSLQIENSPSIALAAGNALVEDYPDEKLAFMSRGLILASLERYEEAIADYTRAIELDPAYTAAYVNRGNVYDDMERYEEALADYTRAIELDPALPESYFNRANGYVSLEQYDAAIADYTRALELDATYTNALTGRARVYALLERYEESLADYDRALALDPDDVSAYTTRGLTYVALGDLSAAGADFAERARRTTDILDGERLLPDAQVNVTIRPGQSTRHSITLQRGQIISFTATALDDDADLILILLASDGTALTYNDDASGETLNSRIHEYTVPKTGTYTLLVTYFNITSATSVLVTAATGASGPTQAAQIGENPGAIPVAAGQRWRYAGQAGETLTITVVAEWDTTVEVLRGEESLGFNDDGDGLPNFNSRLSITLPETAEYTIEVRSFRDSFNGTYTLVIDSSRASSP